MRQPLNLRGCGDDSGPDGRQAPAADTDTDGPIPASSQTVESTAPTQEHTMKAVNLTAALVLALSSAFAVAGEIKDSEIRADQLKNEATGTGSKAHQWVGVARGNGKIDNSEIKAQNARNTASGANSHADQRIGYVYGNGEIKNSTVFADNARNVASGSNSYARQEIGVAGGNGKIKDSHIHADQASNKASGSNSEAKQRVGFAD